MSFREDLLDLLVSKMRDTGVFKKVYRNRIPEYSTVNNYPSAAVAWTAEEFVRPATTRRTTYMGEITVMLYSKQKASNRDDDTISPLLDKIFCVVNDRSLCNGVQGIINVEIGSVKRDMGTLHPIYLAEVKLYVEIQQSATTADCG